MRETHQYICEEVKLPLMRETHHHIGEVVKLPLMRKLINIYVRRLGYL